MSDRDPVVDPVLRTPKGAATDAPVALITGGNSGIGRAVALQMAQRGWRLALAARRGELLEQVGDEAERAGAADLMLRFTNLAHEVEPITMVEWVHEAWGRIDVLINCAGMAPLNPIGTIKPMTVHDTFEINAIAPALAVNAVWPIMKAQGGGRIVSVSSAAAIDPFPGFFIYAATKAAVNSYARSIAIEGKRLNIRGFAIAPGAVETPMLRSLFNQQAIPPSAALSPDEVAALIVCCALGEADEWNGRSITIRRGTDGGVEIEPGQ